jgi:uroporphyrinogen decarboxylase
MTKLERLRAAIRREPTDRTPYAFWRHFPATDRSPAALAQSTLRFHERYGSDWLKVTPTGGYAVEDWGCVESAQVEPDGHRACATHAVREPADWRRIRPLPMSGTGWGAHLETIVRCVIDKRADAPVLPTVFSPLSLARKLAGERLGYDLAENTQLVVDALEAITETILAFAEAVFAEGAQGFFYSVQAASLSWHTEEEYARFGEPYDRRILEAARARAQLTVLHAHGDRLMFDRLAALPADVWNWDDRRSGPSLREGRALVPGAVAGGMNQWTTLRDGTAAAAIAEARDAVAQTDGRGLVLAAGCVLLHQHVDAPLVELIRSLGGQVKLAGVPPQ